MDVPDPGLAVTPQVLDDAGLLAAFRAARAAAECRARWAADDPQRPPDTCRYCGKGWQPRVGSRLDGHAACIVTEDFKRQVGAVLKASPLRTYAGIAAVLGVTPGIVSSWSYSAGISGPVDHRLRRAARRAP